MELDKSVNNKPKKSRFKKELRDWSTALVLAVVLSFLIQNYAFAQVKVINISMQNTLVEGQRLFEDKITYHISTPKRGDIVIIDDPTQDRNLVKRVIGLPGETIDIRDGYVFINGVKLEEAYTKGMTYPRVIKMPYTIPAKHIFVMGDNREQSDDSRTFGAVKYDDIEGRVVLRVWPLSEFGSI
ncbi:signal peptidase I [Paenibacillus sp. MMS18-CY102]|uniref:signal peptidase I n=1 Tax=Paenibacillus sp. MMS18-CY102 TaxID=2682849 RepID=UPI001365EFB9|nr:signal peptidase I [Paenibacillus sp. MMS18-CY102]MWC29336.1 signal peptidase I [Paenibacillus sp. MMS18-CY102]